MEHLKKFNTQEEYQEWKDGDDYVFPSVCKVGDDVVYNNFPEPFWIEALEDISVNYYYGDKYSFNGYWSYDKINWTKFNTSDIILRAGKKLYIYDTFSGQSLHISGKYNVGGSILSLVYGLDYLNYDSHSINYFINLFKNAKSVVNAKELVLATTLKAASSNSAGMYYSLFEGCTLLESAPKLPATTLVPGCYNKMFFGCSSLRKAPSLLATNIDYVTTNKYSYWYKDMFNGCSNLSYIKMLLSSTFDGSDTTANWSGNWVSGVSSTGTFIANSKRTNFTRGVNGIPEGWDLYLYDEDKDKYVVKFKVNNIPYEMYTDEPRDVTWGEFIESKQNTNGFKMWMDTSNGDLNPTVRTSNLDYVLSSGDRIYGYNNIILNTSYTIGQPTETTEE